MKKIIFALLIATLCCSCSRWHNEPGFGNPYYGQGTPEPNDPITHTWNPSTCGICEDYANRYSLADGLNIVVTDMGTLGWYDTVSKRYIKLCWTDLAIRTDRGTVDIYRLNNGVMCLQRSYPRSTELNLVYDTFTIIPNSAGYPCPIKVYIFTRQSKLCVSLNAGSAAFSEELVM